MARGTSSIGDGDRCPVTPEHGAMLTIRGSGRQQCPHQSHDGAPKSAPGGARPQTRSIWPQAGFEVAVHDYLGG